MRLFIEKILNTKNFTYKELIGGLANKTYKVCSENNNYILRKFGNITIENRSTEIEIINLLAKFDISRKIVNEFDGGLLETYIEGNTLNINSMSNNIILKKISYNMKIMHNINNKIGNNIFNKINALTHEIKKKKYYNQELFNYIDSINTQKYDSLPKGLCHNDLLFENIIFNSENNKLSFIDLEYAGYNFIHFDIANFFCEICGMNCDISLFPDQKFRYKFYNYYNPNIDNLEKFDHNVLMFVKYSHLLWGLWSLNCYLVGKISNNFNYLNYSKLKFNQINIST